MDVCIYIYILICRRTFTDVVSLRFWAEPTHKTQAEALLLHSPLDRHSQPTELEIASGKRLHN